MSRDDRQSYFDSYFEDWYDRDDPYRDTGVRKVPRRRDEYMTREDVLLENFYAAGL